MRSIVSPDWLHRKTSVLGRQEAISVIEVTDELYVEGADVLGYDLGSISISNSAPSKTEVVSMDGIRRK